MADLGLTKNGSSRLTVILSCTITAVIAATAAVYGYGSLSATVGGNISDIKALYAKYDDLSNREHILNEQLASQASIITAQTVQQNAQSQRIDILLSQSTSTQIAQQKTSDQVGALVDQIKLMLPDGRRGPH